MDPHTQLYYAWNIPNTSTLQSTTQTPPVPQSPLQYATQQQQVGQADFTGQGFPGSGPPPYQPQSAQTIPTTSATPVSQQSSQNQNILSYPFARQSGVTSSSILNGTNVATFPSAFSYFQNTGSIPTSAYSSLSGATGGLLSSTSSTPNSLFTLQRQPSSLQQPSQSGSASANGVGVGTIDPSLLSNPAATYTRTYGTMSSAMTGVQQYGVPAQHQYMQPPQIMIGQQSAQGYSNSLANRTPTPQAMVAQSPPVIAPVPAPAPAPVPVAAPAPAPPTPLPNGGFPANWKETITHKAVDREPEKAANQIIAFLKQSKWNEIDCATRVEIMTLIRDHAGSEFYKVWAKSLPAIEVIQDWLRATVSDDNYDRTLMPILFVTERLPITLDVLRSSKIGKVIVKVVKIAPSQAVKDLATSIETKWRKLLPAENAAAVKTEEGAAAKKRKIEASGSKSAPPAKKAAVGSSSASKPAQTVVKKIGAPAKETKLDSSFFSTKPKAKLPSFTKKTAAVKKEEPDANVAQPSTIDPFQEALKSMVKQVGSPAQAPAPEPVVEPLQTATVVQEAVVTLGRNGKPKKRVTFPVDDKLVQIKLIERAIYDDDASGEGSHHSSYRDLDIDEGHALHALMFEEQVDWYEPASIEMPADVVKVVFARGIESSEKVAQEERESSALEAVYMTPSQIPETPGESRSGMDAPPDESGMAIMLVGDQVADLEAPSGVPAATIADLLARINTQLDPNSIAAAAAATSAGPPPPYEPYAAGNNQYEEPWNAYGQPQAGSSSDWDIPGLPPPTGHTGLDDNWERRGPPTGPRAGADGGRGNQPRPPPGLYKIKAACKFYNTRAGQVHDPILCVFEREVTDV